jgi:alpha-D-ribose 1-methylphosphonate 5-triphosphate diphosphatase
MHRKQISHYGNCRVVTGDGVIFGTVTVKDGMIFAIDDDKTFARKGVLDLQGDYLLPGLIEMHTDNLEKHLVPRPGVLWPSPASALLAHDAQLASAGITTVLDAVCVGWFLDDMRPKLLALSVDAVKSAVANNLLRADHLLHMRCETADPFVVDLFAPHAENSLIRLVSFMDHTPGQRQWLDIDKYRLFHQADNWSDTELRSRITSLQENQAKYTASNKQLLAGMCSTLGVPLASHDDTEETHVEQAYQEGATISEFPTTLSAAKKARKLAMDVIAGAPNLVRGESHSGNVSATELGRQRLITGLSSDYVPVSLLAALFKLHLDFHYTLPEAVSLASANVARMLGLDDRGEIVPGKRADLIRVQLIDELPVVRSVWRQGLRIA